MVYRLAGQYRDFFLDKHILSDRDCTRMNDAVLITSMIILLLKGIVDETPNSVDKIYNEFNDEFVERDSIEAKFVSIMEIIERVYEYFIGNLSCLSNKNYFFTFYAVIVNQMFGIENNHILNSERNPDFSESLITNNIDTLYQMCGNFLNEYTENVVDSSSKQSTKSEWATFVENNSKRTTSKNARLSRISFMNGYFCRQSK
ncbi:MAG: hypothetical protein J6V99_07820 [Neisseriaceae bacterium]|nr:hypothetical protein [Neisseriaceae bacterium]